MSIFQNWYLDFLIKSSFQGVKRLFELLIGNTSGEMHEQDKPYRILFTEKRNKKLQFNEW